MHCHMQKILHPLFRYMMATVGCMSRRRQALTIKEVSIMPLLTREEMVTTERSFKESLSSLDHTSPNNISSFNSANFGAKSFKASLPAVCFTISISSLIVTII